MVTLVASDASIHHDLHSLHQFFSINSTLSTLSLPSPPSLSLSLMHRTVASEVRKQVSREYGSPQLSKKRGGVHQPVSLTLPCITITCLNLWAFNHLAIMLVHPSWVAMAG